MSHDATFYEWKARVAARFGDLKPHHQSALAEYSFGMILGGAAGLTTVVAALAVYLAVAADALRQRLRELYLPADAQIGTARSEFDATLCFGPLVRWATAGQADKRLVLALDPTNLTDRFRVLCAAVLCHGGGIPVAWAVQSADQKGSWNDIWAGLLGRLRRELGDGWTVLVLTDRGLESAALFRTITALGWHPLMRVKAAGTFRPAGWRGAPAMSWFAAGVGRRWAGAGTAYATGLDCTLLASWDAGHEEPWLVLTDLPPGGASCGWYAWRMWIEQGFRAVKRGAWKWHLTQMTDPARVARVWAALALATLYAVSAGSEPGPVGLPPVGGPLSRLKRGLLSIWHALLGGESLPEGRIVHPTWPEPDGQSDLLVEQELDTC